MKRQLLKNAVIVTSRRTGPGEILIEGERIAEVRFRTEAEESPADGRSGGGLSDHGGPGYGPSGKGYSGNGPEHDIPSRPLPVEETACPAPENDIETIDLKGLHVMAGVIDAHVHFREPGMTHKGDLASESRAALLGGVTSFVDMPNTAPATVCREALQDKLDRAAGRAFANYGFHFGATNDNAGEIESLLAAGEGRRFGAVKVFMGSSTGGLLVDREETLDRLFRLKGKPLFVHSEDEGLIRENRAKAERQYGRTVPFRLHPEIRSRAACVRSTAKALDLALKYGTRLHLLHLSTAEETALVREAKRQWSGITAETAAHYLWFSEEDYGRLGGLLKCNPAVKTAEDRAALIRAVRDGTIDTIGSDHAPHLLSEKAQPYSGCPSGLPGVGCSLPALLSLATRHGIPLDRLAALLSENIAALLGIRDRGRIEKGGYADLVAFDPAEEYRVTAEDIHGRCGWSPYLGEKFTGRVRLVWLNGRLAVRHGEILGAPAGKPLQFG